MMAVNAHPKNGRWATALSWLAGASALWYAFSRLLPLSPQLHHSLLDDSWMMALHPAFAQHWQFGRDIVFTYGPWGFLCGGYSPPTFAVSVIVWTLLTLVFWRAAWRMAHHLSGYPLVAWLWLMGFIAVTGMSVEQSIDLRLAGWSVLLLLLHFFVEDHPFTPLQAGLAVSLGVLSLTKFTGLVEAVVVVAIIAADNVLRQKRFPWLALLFVTSVLFFWVAAGQNPGGLGPFLQNSWRITTGYTEAMIQVGEEESRDVGGFLLAAAPLVALTGYVAWKRCRFWGTLPIAGLGFILFLTFKQGYVRYDDGHTVRSVLALLSAALACLAVTWPVLRREKPWLAVTGLFLLTGILYFASSTVRGWHPKNGLLMQLTHTFGASNVLAPAKLLYGTDYWQKENETHLRQIRAEYPVPPLEGSVDVYPWNQATLLAHGLAYHPRPVIQSYSAYTPELAELNAAFLRSNQAASNILFEIRLMDDRFPSLNDGRSWPELLTRYDVQDTTGTFVLLKRSATSRQFQLKPFQDRPFRFGEPILLPATNNSPIWAEIEINKSILGSAVSMLYKPPVLTLAVSLRNGRELRYRLVPGMARSGFLLSPLIKDNMSFVALAAAGGERSLADVEVTSVTLSADTPSGSTACYQSPLRLQLYHLDYPRQDLPGMAAGSATPSIPPPPEKPGRTN